MEQLIKRSLEEEKSQARAQLTAVAMLDSRERKNFFMTF